MKISLKILMLPINVDPWIITTYLYSWVIPTDEDLCIISTYVNSWIIPTDVNLWVIPVDMNSEIILYVSNINNISHNIILLIIIM